MSEQEQREPSSSETATPRETVEKSAREAIIGSAALQAEPVNVAPEAPSEIPRAAVGTPAPQASVPSEDGGSGGDGAQQ